MLEDIVLSACGYLEALGPVARWQLFSRDDSTRRAWITTLQKLSSSRPNSKTSQAVIELWVTLGHAHDYTKRSELAWLETHRHPIILPHCTLAWCHCAWSGCMCYEQRPLYRLSACKGCWRVYYCGRVCQQKSVVIYAIVDYD